MMKKLTSETIDCQILFIDCFVLRNKESFKDFYLTPEQMI